MSKKMAMGGLVLLAAVYVASPYVALYRLGEALRAGDVDTVQSAVDWGRVRAGIKTEVGAGPAAPIAARDELPAFGASFIKGVVGHMVDKVVTPESLCASMQNETARAVASSGRIGWAFFTSPDRFTAQIYQADGQPMHVHMALEHGHWKVIHVDLPTDRHRT